MQWLRVTNHPGLHKRLTYSCAGLCHPLRGQPERPKGHREGPASFRSALWDAELAGGHGAYVGVYRQSQHGRAFGENSAIRFLGARAGRNRRSAIGRKMWW